jgi:cyclomaltodextrinase / maltogenic alpha-amylase / neopullulanase
LVIDRLLRGCYKGSIDIAVRKDGVMNRTLIGVASLLALAACVSAAAPTPLNEREARPSAEWVTRGVMYQIQPRAFTPEGTLRAATARLPKVAELGFDIIYLCPVFVADDDPNVQGWSPRQKKSGMNNPRNPYRMKDYYHVDPEYGTDDDLKAFIAEAHRLGMRVLLDMVYLHCGPNAVFLAEHPDFVKRDAEGNVAVAGWGFPALNLANPELREYLWKNMEYWVREFGADGFRCDVSDGIPLDFWETARDRLEKIRPDVCMLAEGTRREDQLKAFDLDYGWGFKWDNAASVRKQWEKMRDERPRGGARFIRFIDNHDIANDSYDNRIEKAWGTRWVNATLVALFTLDGVPMIYNGQEVADTARHSIFGRSPIDWASGDTPTGKTRFAFCQQLCATRHAERALTHGAVVWLDNDQPDAVLSFLRRAAGEEILSVVNLSDHALKVRVTFPEPTQWSHSTLLAEGVTAETDDNSFLLNLEGFGYLVAKRK